MNWLVDYDVSTIFSLTIFLMANHVRSFLGHESADLLYIYEMFLFTGQKDDNSRLYTVQLYSTTNSDTMQFAF